MLMYCLSKGSVLAKVLNLVQTIIMDWGSFDICSDICHDEVHVVLHTASECVKIHHAKRSSLGCIKQSNISHLCTYTVAKRTAKRRGDIVQLLHYETAVGFSTGASHEMCSASLLQEVHAAAAKQACNQCAPGPFVWRRDRASNLIRLQPTCVSHGCGLAR